MQSDPPRLAGSGTGGVALAAWVWKGPACKARIGACRHQIGLQPAQCGRRGRRATAPMVFRAAERCRNAPSWIRQSPLRAAWRRLVLAGAAASATGGCWIGGRVCRHGRRSRRRWRRPDARRPAEEVGVGRRCARPGYRRRRRRRGGGDFHRSGQPLEPVCAAISVPRWRSSIGM